MEIKLSMKLETPAENLGEILKLMHHIEYLVPEEAQNELNISRISDVQIGDQEYPNNPCLCETCDPLLDAACIHRVYARFEQYANENPCMSRDEIVEMLWREMEDVPMDENSKGELILNVPWRGFPRGFTQDEWFHWVDEHHSKGVGWVFENI